MARDVMPDYTIIILIVQYCKAGLIMPFLKSFNCESDWITDFSKFSGFYSIMIIWLRFSASKREKC